MTALRLVALLVVVSLSVSRTGGTMSVEGTEVLPPLHMPEENFFRVGPGLRTQDLGIVVSVRDHVIIIQRTPYRIRSRDQDGTVLERFEVVPALPQKYYFHPCMWNGGLAMDADGPYSYTEADLKPGDWVTFDTVTDPRDNRWIHRIRITARPGGKIPPERRNESADPLRQAYRDRANERDLRIHNARMQQQAAQK